jgi:hypothetical protein
LVALPCWLCCDGGNSNPRNLLEGADKNPPLSLLHSTTACKQNLSFDWLGID